MTDLDIFDHFDNNIVITGISFVPAATGVPTTPLGPGNYTAPSQLLIGTVTPIVGTGAGDVVATIDFYIPEFDADGNRIIPLDGSDPVPTENSALSVGDWDPIDPRDTGGTDNAVAAPDPNNPAHTLQDKSIAIQKSVAVVGGGSGGPGVQLEYTLEFQISDYYTFGDFIIDDSFSDGQDFLISGVPVFPATFTTIDRDRTTSGTFTLGASLGDPGVDLTHVINGDGTETLVFDVSKAMQAFGEADGILVGGLATAPDDLNRPPLNVGLTTPATGTIVFRTFVPDDYDQLPPSGETGITQGDTLSNDATIAGSVRDNGSIGTPIGTEGDDTSSSISIPVGSVSKSLYAVNGITPVPADLILAPGDDVTYSLTYIMPLSSFVDFSLTDFLPLPVFDVTDPDGDGVLSGWTFNVEPPGAGRVTPPAPGVVEFGPGDTLYDFTGNGPPPAGYTSPPTITTDPPANAVAFTYGTFDDSGNQSRTVNLLFTVTTTDTPFGDGLQLTNLVRGEESNSSLEATDQDAIVQIRLGQPVLGVTKGVVATNHPSPPAAFDPVLVGPPVVTFNSPGSSPSFSGNVTSNGLAANPIDSNLQDIDAGDVITFEILVQHTGTSNADALDVNMIDLINNAVPDNKMTYVPSSVVVVNAGGATGNVPPYDLGGDISVTWTEFPLGATSTITFDVTLDNTINPEEILVNTASVTWTRLPGDVTAPQSSNPYSVERTGDPLGPGETGANDYRESDFGVVLTPTFVANKEVVDTSEPSTGTGQHRPLLEDLTIGETVTFAIVVDFIDGTTPGVVITDDLPILPLFPPAVLPPNAALQYLNAAVVFVGSDLTSSGDILNPTITVSDRNGDNVPDRVALDVGDIFNSPGTEFDLPEYTKDQLVIAVQAQVINELPPPFAGVEVNQDGMLLTNTSIVSSTGVLDIVDTSQVDIVEPDLTITKMTDTTIVDGGDTITFTMTVDHTAASTADAFDVSITDVIPTGLTYANNVTPALGPGPLVSVVGQTVTFFWDEIPLVDNTYEFTFEVTVDPSIVPGDTFVNTGDLVWFDTNGDGVQDLPPEAGLPGVGVTAVWAGPDGMFGTPDDVTLTTITDANGLYAFNGLPAGEYRVTVDTATIVPAGLIPSYDLDGVLDSTTTVALGAGQNRDDVDFGYTEPSSIQGLKWSDTNGNGIQDGGEVGLAGVRIYIDTNNNGVLDVGEPETATGADGSYAFVNLLPDTYVIRELRPDNTLLTYPGGDGSHTILISTGGTDIVDIDFGNQYVQPIVIDNDDPGFEMEGEWTLTLCFAFWGGDARFRCDPPPGGTGENALRWRFTGLPTDGTYQVSTTWIGGINRTVDAPFTVSGGAAPVTTIIDQQIPPSAYPDSFRWDDFYWANLGPAYTIIGSQLLVELTDDHSGGCIIGDAVRVQQVTTPEITVYDGSLELTSGLSTVDLGGTPSGSPIQRTFTVTNDGGDQQLLPGPITVPIGYSLVSSFGQPALGPGQSTTFTVQLDATTDGIYSGTIAFGTNDNDRQFRRGQYWLVRDAVFRC